MLEFQGLVEFHFLFQVIQGRFAIEEAGFQGDTYVITVFVQDPVEEAAVLV